MLKTASEVFKMSWLRQRFAAALDPMGDPKCHLFIRDARLAKKTECFLGVAEKRVGRFLSFELHGFAKARGKIFGDTADAKCVRPGDVYDERRRGGVEQRSESGCARIGLPDGVEIAHGKRDRLAGIDALSDINEDAVAEFRGVIKTENGSFYVCGAAEMFEDALAAEAAHGIFADGIWRIGLERASARNRSEAIDIPGGERCDAAVAKTFGDEARKKGVHGPGEPFLAG